MYLYIYNNKLVLILFVNNVSQFYLIPLIGIFFAGISNC